MPDSLLSVPNQRHARVDTIVLDGVELAKVTERDIVARVVDELSLGHGGRIATVNTDILRGLNRDPSTMRLVEGDVLAVADGMPLVWASRIQGDPLPGRVNGTNLLLALCEAAGARRLPIFLLGAPPGVAATAASILEKRFPGLGVFGTSSPAQGFELDPERMAEVARDLAPMGPGIVFCAFGFPKQEIVMDHLSASNPDKWFVACGGSLEMITGAVKRAPWWMQASGLEWLVRLVQEPRRLAGRYLKRDLPYLLGLMGRSLAARRRDRNSDRPA